MDLYIVISVNSLEKIQKNLNQDCELDKSIWHGKAS